MEKPILFSTEMVRAILDGRKTQTRRVMKPQPKYLGNDVWEYGDDCFVGKEVLHDHLFHNVYGVKGSPYGATYSSGTSDTLWVRETWKTELRFDDCKPSDLAIFSNVYYPANDEVSIANPGYAFGKTRPSIYMPRWASRINLNILDVRIEQLQDASTEDLIAEGCPREHCPEHCNGVSHAVYGWFQHLWDEINLKRGYPWASNCWVWVVEFEVMK